MQKNIQFAQLSEVEIKNEVVGGILLDIHPITSADALCEIADLNKISVDLILERANGEQTYIFEDYLENVLVGLYSQTTRFELAKRQYADSKSYKVMLSLNPSVIVLNKGDVLRLKIKAENIAFTSLSNTKSWISVESIPAFGSQTPIPVLKSHAIGSGETSIDKEVGDAVVKTTLLTDLGADYMSSTKAKPTGVDIFAQGYEKSVSIDLLVAENVNYLDMNPETDIQDLVLYGGSPINAVRVKAKFDKAVDSDARLLVLSLTNA